MRVRNEADFIGTTLAAVLAQDYPQLEVLVIDADIQAARSEIIARVDGHTLIAPDYICLFLIARRLPLVFAVIHLGWRLGFWRSFGEMLFESGEETTSAF